MKISEQNVLSGVVSRNSQKMPLVFYLSPSITAGGSTSQMSTSVWLKLSDRCCLSYTLSRALRWILFFFFKTLGSQSRGSHISSSKAQLSAKL